MNPLTISDTVIWSYSVFGVILAIGLVSIFLRGDWQKARGFDKLILFGPLFYAAPLAAFGTEHFTLPNVVASLVPSWIPWHLFWAYFVGACFVAAALSLVTRIQARPAASLLALTFFLFVALMDLPSWVHNPRDRFGLTLALRELAFSGGALAMAASLSDQGRERAPHIQATIARYFVGIPVLFFALLASKPVTLATQDSAVFGIPLIFKLAHYAARALGSSAPIAQLDASRLLFHPTAIAAWVGMFATALNLIPGGQLDGGHILFAIHPKLHRAASLAAIVCLLPLAWFFWAGWLIWAVVLRLTGRHPPVPNSPPLNTGRKWLAVFALLMLVLTFSYDPIKGSGIWDLIREFHKSDNASTSMMMWVLGIFWLSAKACKLLKARFSLSRPAPFKMK